ncbi:MAG: hypothetical protein NVS1B13_17290 [Flavisolibacter sp.]
MTHLKTTIKLMKQMSLPISFLLLLFYGLPQQLLAQATPEASLGWQLGVQTWSFNKFTLAESIEKVDSLGVKYIQAFPGQRLGGDMEGSLDYLTITPQTEHKLLALLKSKGMHLISFGVVSPTSEKDWKKLFEFAHDMHLQSIASEPAPSFLGLVGRLATKYKIKVALHNHPIPNHYWSPDTTSAAIKTARSPYMGVNADIGHWVRSGLDPVKCLHQLQGHIFALHLKDLSEKKMNGHDVVWGSGVSNVDGVLKELRRQKFKGPIFAEYEYHWDNNSGEIGESIKSLRQKIIAFKNNR